MRVIRWIGGALTALLVAATPARGDLTASYDGLLVPKRGVDAVVAASFIDTNGNVIGTVALDLSDGSVSGLFPVTGKVRNGKLRMSGIDGTSRAKLTWKARIDGETLVGKARVRGGGQKIVGVLDLSRRQETPPSGPPPEHCDNAFFTGQVMGLVLSDCVACHSDAPSSPARHTRFRVTLADPIATQDSVAGLIDTANPANSLILQKPLRSIPHVGGVRFQAGSNQHQVLEQWVNLVASGQQCSGGPTDSPTTPLAPAELLVRAAMDLGGRRPSPAQLDAMEAQPDTFEAFVNEYLHSAEFLERVKDAYDDALLVRREDFTDELRDETWAIYGEALELIAYVVGNDRPFTELGTADYTVANELFQRDVQRMPYPMDPVAGLAWQPTHYTDGRPHAGLLSTSAFYEVWDTNNTNLNRRRANRWSIVFHCYNFLDTPVDVTRDVDNNDSGAVLSAVTTRADCKACHDRLDPMASFLFPMDNAFGLEEGDADSFFDLTRSDRWRTANKRPPAMYGTPGGDVRDLGRLLVDHPRFAECQTRRAFKMLFQREPKTNLELNLANDIATRWRTEDGYNYRKLVKRWMLSDAYRQRPVEPDPEWVRRASPERLETLVRDLTGFVWSREPENDQDDADPESDPPRTATVPLLTTEEDGFRIILGSINGSSVTGRANNLNASVVMVQRKLAALAADYVVTTDLALPDGTRTLLNGVTGAEDPAVDEAALRTRLSQLARRCYGVAWATDSEHVDVLFQLYRSLYRDRSQAGTNAGQVSGTQGERAWRGVLIAMLRSPRLLIY